MLKAEIIKYPLIFKIPGGTSRGVLKEKDSWFIKIFEENNPTVFGLGECSIIKGLSYDDRPDLDQKIRTIAENINVLNPDEILEIPALNFAIETALLDLKNNGQRILFPSDFTHSNKSIPINGLVWMGKPDFMQQQIQDKIEQGYHCIKLKIGAIDFETELKIIQEIRKNYAANEIQIRVDANGAFHPNEAMDKLKYLSEFDLHSIEQPIQAGQVNEMQKLCQKTPLPIALDEELIGVIGIEKKRNLLKQIQPQYIILKPSLIGGFAQSEEWIHLAKELKTGWWVTSALESNIGLNAIAQWTFTLNNLMYQGLGTGQVFSNNITSPLEIDKGNLYYSSKNDWNLKPLGL